MCGLLVSEKSTLETPWVALAGVEGIMGRWWVVVDFVLVFCAIQLRAALASTEQSSRRVVDAQERVDRQWFSAARLTFFVLFRLWCCASRPFAGWICSLVVRVLSGC